MSKSNVSNIRTDFQNLRQYFHDWEKENYLPTLEILETLADYFDVALDYLVGRID